MIVNRVDSDREMGILFSYNLSFSFNTNFIINKIFKMLDFILRLENLKKILKMLFCSLVGLTLNLDH